MNVPPKKFDIMNSENRETKDTLTNKNKLNLEEKTMKAVISKQVIEMTKAEEKAAGTYGTVEFEELANLRKEFPNFRMVTKASKRKDNMKGLNIPYMKNYIEKHDNEDGTNMAIFNQLRGLDEAGNKVEFARVASTGELRMWFLDTYPEVEDMNKTVDDILAKVKKNREAKRLAAAKAA